MWAGIAGAVVNNNTSFEIAISVHDSVYNTDFASSIIPYDPKDPDEQAAAIEKHTLDVLRKFSSEHMCKFLGAGVTVSLLREVRPFGHSCFLPPFHPSDKLLSEAQSLPDRVPNGSVVRNAIIPCASTASAERKPEGPQLDLISGFDEARALSFRTHMGREKPFKDRRKPAMSHAAHFDEDPLIVAH